ncbi:MAG TPA: DUF4249 domain-containing protein [Sphingobacteriaceae bacterium]
MKFGRNFLVVVTVLQLLCCKEPFDPSVESGSGSYLVVEGIISTTGTSTIRLSQSLQISDNNKIKNLPGAEVRVEGEDSSIFPSTDEGNGVYTIPHLNLAIGQKYRLRITIPGGKEYLSDFTTAQATPAIDNVEWVRDDKGVSISVDTHDPGNNTRYYMWDYEETWETRSYDYSNFKVVNAGVNLRLDPRDTVEANQMYTCWKTARSTNILVSSSANLSSDVISDFPLVHIPAATEKLGVRYSILVRQYALTRPAFEYLQRMKKNSEQMGSVFDPQPSEARGNIRCITNPDEPVIGYISIAPVSEKRIFIRRSDVRQWNYSLGCETGYVLRHPDSLKNVFSRGDNIPISEEYSNGGEIVGYYYSNSVCMDCRITGSSIKPAFW